MASETLIRLCGVAIGYRGKPLLGGIDLDLQAGDFLAVVGPNGGGKTTLLKTILGLLRPITGTLIARHPSGRGVRFGYVPQREQLDRVFPLRAREVVLMGRYALVGYCRFPGRSDRRAAHDAMERVGVGRLADRPFRDMSGGEQQKTLIARALAADPDVLALDEPTNGMDLPSEGAAMDLLRELHRGGMTLLMISHVLSTVLNHADRIAYLDKDEGVFRVGSIDEMVREDVLGELYGVPVRIGAVGDHRVVMRQADATRRNPAGGAAAGAPAKHRIA